MAKRKFAPWGTSPVDHLVAEFLREKGISPDDLQGYTINRSVEDVGTITFSMLFEEDSVEPDPAPPVLQDYLVGESGPELVPPDTWTDEELAAARQRAHAKSEEVAQHIVPDEESE